jgi:hypothetical protein
MVADVEVNKLWHWHFRLRVVDGLSESPNNAR